MIEESLVETRDFFEKNGYKYYYEKRVFVDFNNEIYEDFSNAKNLLNYNEDLEDVLIYFIDKTSSLNFDENLKEMSIDFLENLLEDFYEK